MEKPGEITTMTLDAGGTNFVFSAIQNAREVVYPVTLPSNAHDLKACLNVIIEGFELVKSRLANPPAAISFAFPGPADYQFGIIGNLPNFNAFNGNVPLGPILEDYFGIPVFINNDGSLFAYGEALYGALPEIKQKLIDSGQRKKFQNLIGITLGTGIGCGIVTNGNLLIGDNSCAGEIHNTLNTKNPKWNAEESISTRAIQRVYAEASNLDFDGSLMPDIIYQIARGEREGNRQAALESFEQFGTALGDTIANVISLIDGLVVLGGGISAGHELFMPALMERVRMSYINHKLEKAERLSYEIFNLSNLEECREFLTPNPIELPIPGSERTIIYDNAHKSGIILSKLGANKSIALGAHAFAISKLSQ